MKTTNASAPGTANRSTDPSHPSTGLGRPTTYNPRAVEILLALIREGGLSDSAAAAKAAISTSSLSRWKREYPEFALALLQAREEFRDTHLQIIFEAAKARGGWRASAWILQHVFPGDYSPRAAEREKFQRLAEPQFERKEAEAELAPAAPEPPADASRRSSSSAEVDSSPQPDSQNSQNTPFEPGLLEEVLSGIAAKDSQKSRPLPQSGRMGAPAVTFSPALR